MNQHMSNNWSRIWLIIVTVLVAAILAGIWANATYSAPFFPQRLRPPQVIPGDFELFYTTKAIVSTVNVALSIVLLATYLEIYTKTKSEFTIALLLFSLVVLLNALASNPIVVWFFGFQASGLGPFATLPDIFTSAALIVLLYLSIKY